MFKITHNFNSQKFKHDLEKSIRKQIQQDPRIMENAIMEQKLSRYRDPTGLKPKIKARPSSGKEFSISVLNGDDAFKQRVLDFFEKKLK